jgi:23S rRNA pseudouridine1911/1915/1917 synthase
MNDFLENEEECYEHYKFVADKGQGLLRIDKFLNDRMGDISRTRIQTAAKTGNILVNGKSVKPNYRVRPLDEITVVFPTPPQEFDLIAEDIKLDIIYEDSDVMVINKPAGLVVHPGHGNYTGTLVNGLLYHQQSWPEINGGERPGIVHRLDKNTSGVMVVGKTETALSFLARQFFERTIKRNYTALVWGDFDDEEGTISGNIGRSFTDRKLMKVFPYEDGGKHAVTHYKVLKRFGYVTLVDCKLETGRTHQIRVHMQYIGHSLFGDYGYGGDKILKGTVYTKYKQFIENCFELMPHQSLHARSLGFIHPTTKKEMFFEVPLPANFQELLTKWERYTQSFNIE